MIIRVILFVFLNFFALGIGGFFTGMGVSSSWYMELAKAPWTPPGWVFGFAWTSIMFCFSFYMAFLWKEVEEKFRLILLYSIQWILNVSWNPAFFYYHHTSFSMLIITLLTILIAFIILSYRRPLGWKSVLLLPYLVWLLIASSLNGYIVVWNR